MSETLYVSADEVRAGMSIPSLDNAYVIEVDSAPEMRNEYNVNLADGLYLIIYNDAVGNEGYLLLTPDTRIEVTR